MLVDMLWHNQVDLHDLSVMFGFAILRKSHRLAPWLGRDDRHRFSPTGRTGAQCS